MRLIDADALQDHVQRKKQPTIASERHREGFNDAISRVKSMIHSAPTIDSTKSARWKGEGFGDYRCSLCDETVSGQPNFCPNCGAEMR